MTTRKREIPIDGKERAAAGSAGNAQAGTGGWAEADKVAGAGVERGAASASGETGVPVDEGEALVRERDELAESLLRLRAEFDNYRKRATRELTDARVCAEGDLLADLLPVLDNLERALDAAEHHEEGKVLQGVRLTRDLFVGLLGRAGVEEIPGIGTQFDPQVHEAVLVQPSEQAEGLVTAVLERGYRQGTQVLRPARVAVSAGRDEADCAEGPGVPDRHGQDAASKLR
jgi:molecular chaperone GrpE